EAMRTIGEANKYFSEQAPWKLRESDPERMRTVLHVALQLVDDGKTLLTPFLPRSSQKVYEMLGGSGFWSGTPRIDEVTEDAGARPSPVDPGTRRRRGGRGPRPDPPGAGPAPPHAAVPQARPGPGRRGAGRAGARVPAGAPARPAPPPEPLPADALDSHTHLD